MKWFAVGSSVNVLRGVFQKIKSRAGGGRFRPGILFDLSRLRHQDDHPDTAGSGNGQRLIQPQLMLGVHDSSRFNRVHDGGNVTYGSQKLNTFQPRFHGAAEREYSGKYGCPTDPADGIPNTNYPLLLIGY